jgi:hypothetical protein
MASNGGYKGEYSAPKHSSSTVRGCYWGSDVSSGVSDGLSMRKDLESESQAFDMNNATSVSGNPRQCVKPYESSEAKEKGNTFKIC